MIDIHIHGLADYDTRTDCIDDILTIAKLLWSRGIKGFCPTIYPAPISSMRRQMAIIRGAMDRQKGNPLGQAGIVGIHLEGPFINPAKAGALDSHCFLEAKEYNLESLLEGFADIVRIITIAPEIEGARALIKSIARRGIIVSMGHSDATSKEAEEAYNAGARGITHLFNAMRGLHHREPGLAGFGLMHSGIYIEIIADPFHLHPKTLELLFRVKPVDRIILISDAVKGASRDSKNAIADESGLLMGGAYTIEQSLDYLSAMGLSDDTLKKITTDNPKAYLEG